MRHLQVYRFIADVARRGSIRKSADHLHITPSALTRRIQDFEEELGTPIFERLPQGMRLNEAGELVLRHIRDQGADFERVLSDISDLTGLRRGHVSLACAQAFVDSVIPTEVASYRASHPQVTFTVEVRDNLFGVEALKSYEADLALLIDPPPSLELSELIVRKQPLCAVMSSTHPLAGYDEVRLKDCCKYPLAMPNHELAIRSLIDEALYRCQLEPLIAVESGSLEFLRSFVLREEAVTFQPLSSVPVSDHRICARPLSKLDLDAMRVVLGQLKGRRLSIAAERFADQLAAHLADMS